MGKHYLVQRDGASDVADILAQTQQYPLELSLDEVTVEIPGHPIEGENWAPQLAPFKPWLHDAALDEKDELDGTDGDLLIVGALGMGISDEERDALIGSAVRGKSRTAGECREEDPATAGMTPHQLWEAGLTPPWRGGATAQAAEAGEAAGATAVLAAEAVESRETLANNRETIDANRETLENNRETSSEERFALNVPLTVREDGEGYAVSAVHLSVLAEHGLAADNLVVVVPSAIAGRPVVRIASEAFARRFTSGAQVRLLVVPGTVEVVGAQAFGSVCAEMIALGAAVNTYDPAPLDMALPAPRLAARRYVVHPDNKKFLVKDGCLLERLGGDAIDGADSATLPTRLLFVEAPYGEKVTLPAGARIVGSAAFAKGCPPPRVLDAPASLERVDGTVAAETIWRSNDPAAMARIAARCGGRVTDFQAIEQEECWYGFSGGAAAAMDAPTSAAPSAAGSDTREAHLVAGPPAPDSVSRRFSSAAHARVQGAAALSPREIAANAANAMVAPVSTADRLALPRAVDGAPLTAIAERALITAPATLVIPDTVRAIADGNAAKGTRKLMLPEGLRTIGAHCFCSRTLVGPVLIPASVTSIGEGSFEYAVVRLATADAVVHITSDQLISCFLTDAPDGIPFDFERYDAQLLAGRGLPDHLGALLHRLAAPFRLEPAMAARIVEALRDRAADAMAAVAREGDIALVRALADGGFLDDEALFERQIERLRASNRTDCVLYLMNWHRDRQEAARATAAATKPQRARDRFAL